MVRCAEIPAVQRVQQEEHSPRWTNIYVPAVARRCSNLHGLLCCIELERYRIPSFPRTAVVVIEGSMYHGADVAADSLYIPPRDTTHLRHVLSGRRSVTALSIGPTSTLHPPKKPDANGEINGQVSKVSTAHLAVAHVKRRVPQHFCWFATFILLVVDGIVPFIRLRPDTCKFI